MRDAVIAVDIGASSGRITACWLAGTQLHHRELYRFDNAFAERDGHLVWDVEGLYKNMCNGLLKRDEELNIKAIGVDTWGVDYVLVDSKGALTAHAFAYRDSRTEAAYKQVIADIGRNALYRTTGIQFMPFNTLYQLKAHRAENQEAFARAHYLLMLPDYLHYRLSGVYANEFTNATTTQLLDHKSKQFAQRLLEYLNLPETLFPPLLPAGSVLGRVNKTTQELTGLPPDVQVITPGSHDTASAVAAHIGSNTTAYISSGTWSLMGVETDAPIVSDRALRYNLTNEGGVYGTNRLLKNIMGMWIINRVREEIASEQSFASLEAAAEQAEPFRTVINPNAADFLNPKRMRHAIDEYAQQSGQRKPRNIGEYARCIYESLALSYRKTLHELEQTTRRSYRVINIIGGGSKNRFLNQLTADVVGCRVLAGPVETSSLGNAVVQMITIGWIRDIAHARELIYNSMQIEEYHPQQKQSVPAETLRLFDALLDTPDATDAPDTHDALATTDAPDTPRKEKNA